MHSTSYLDDIWQAGGIPGGAVPRPPYNPKMVDTPLAYEAATAFHRVRSERRVHGIAVALFLGIMTYYVRFGRLAARGWRGRRPACFQLP